MNLYSKRHRRNDMKTLLVSLLVTWTCSVACAGQYKNFDVAIYIAVRTTQLQ